MADSNKRKIADPIDLNDDDPFAELTRIMGFDPRLTTRSQPANEAGAATTAPKPVAIAPAPAVQAVAHDDFGIDLEKELMGEFADLEPAPTAALPVETAAAIQPDDDVEMVIDDDFEDAFAASLEEQAAPVAVAAEASPAASQAAQPHAESHDDDAAFDDAFAVETGDELDIDLDDLDLSEPLDDEAPAEPELPAEAPVAQRAEAPNLAAADALAEVDMDFSGAFDEALRPDARHDHVTAASPAPEPEQEYEPAYHASEPEAAADDELDLSLEEELSAMLDDAHAEPEVATFAPEPAPSVAPVSDDSRWSALEAEEEEPSDIIAAPVAPAAEYRRPFIDPAIVGRLASFKAAPAPAPQAEPAAEPQDDLDQLLDAMEHEVHPDDHAPAEPQYHPYAAAAVERTEPAYAHNDTAPAAQAYDGYDEEEAPVDYDPAPDVETIDVPEMAVAVADDLDIPELAYEQDEPAASAYDELDADYPKVFAEPAVADEPVVKTSKNDAEDIDLDTDFETLYRSGTAFETNIHGAPSAQPYATASADHGYKAQVRAFDEYDDAASAAPTARDRFVDLDFDNDVQEEIALPGNIAHETRAAPQRRGLLIAAVVGGVALLGGVGALALSFGNGTGADAPVVVKADSSPVKVKPENPGGTSVPNQDNKVYDVVKGADGAAAAPAQDKLVTTSEEPVDMAAVDKADETANDLPGVTDSTLPSVTDNNLPGVMDEDVIVPKAEDRVDPTANTDDAAAENVAVTPRKVKTMVVRADGTLAPRGDPAPSAPVATAPSETASTEAAPAETEMAAAAPLLPATEPPASAGNDKTGAVTSDQPAEPTFQSPGADPVPVKTVKTNTIAVTEEAAADATASVPDTGPAVESRPAQQPVDVVGEVKPEPVAAEQVASANVEPAAIAAGSWSVQIASQPSADSAKSTYQDLAKRYGGVIGGRGVNIVKADIAGKGTYWRVRVPAQSRNDAIKLCTDYKSAGGNCFVSK